MRYRVYFEPIDYDMFKLINLKGIWKAQQEAVGNGSLPLPDISKILPIDKEGFPIDL